jgi:hypothetical protein
MEMQPKSPTNRRAVLSLLFAVLTILSFCVGAAPIPLTALVCYPIAALLGTASLWMGQRRCARFVKTGNADGV